MPAFSTIFAGMGAAASLGSTAKSFFGGGGGGGDNFAVAWNTMQQERIRQQQMQLDASRRQRDIIRRAQVAEATSTANAYAQGSGNSSALEGVRGQISGDAATASQGVEQNLEFGNQLFDLNSQRGSLLWNRSQNQARTQGQMAFTNALFKNAGEIGKLADYGWGKAVSWASQNNWNPSWDINQVGNTG